MQTNCQPKPDTNGATNISGLKPWEGRYGDCNFLLFFQENTKSWIGADTNYKLMSFEDLKALSVSTITNPKGANYV